MIQQRIDEMAAVAVTDLDMAFIANAERVTSLNLAAKDFESTKYKKEIQFMIAKHFFPGFDLSNTLSGTRITTSSLNAVIDQLRSANASGLVNVHKFTPRGIGPGEVLLYFVLDDGHLAGGSEGGDIRIGGTSYEMKAIDVTRNNEAVQFKLGGTVRVSKILNDIVALAEKAGYKIKGTEVPTSILNALRSKHTKEMKALEDEFAKTAYDGYFSHYPMIWIRNKTKKVGEIVGIQNVTVNDIGIHAVTSGTIKPIVKIR